MGLDLFTPIIGDDKQHPNFRNLVKESDDCLRSVLTDWADGFFDRDGKFVNEFQRTFNSSWWELYMFAVLKSLGMQVDFSVSAPDFFVPDANLAIEAAISSHGEGMTPEWQKTMEHLGRPGDILPRYLENLTRLSNAIEGKVRRYREHYSKLPHMQGKAYIIAIHNFSTPDAHQLGDVTMQRLLYDVWMEGSFKKNEHTSLPTGLFLDGGMKEVSGILFSSLATYGKARALSDCKGNFFFQALRIRNNTEIIEINEFKDSYKETLRDGLRLFRNPFATIPIKDELFNVGDIREFKIVDNEILISCHPEGDLYGRQYIRFPD